MDAGAAHSYRRRNCTSRPTSTMPGMASQQAGTVTSDTEEPAEPSGQLCLVSDFAFPDRQHAPTHRAQLCLAPTVSVAIALKLWKPEVRATRRSPPSRATVSVPEAAVHKNDDPMPLQHNVGLTGQFSLMKSKSQPETMKQATNCKFRCCVLCSNSCHIAASLLR